MAIPAGLTGITVTGTYDDASGATQTGSVSFTPTSAVYDASGDIVLTETAIVAAVSGGALSQELVATDSAGLTPDGWGYEITVNVPGAQASWTALIPSSFGSSVSITRLGAPVGGPPPTVVYLPDTSSPPTQAPSSGGGFFYSEAGALYWRGGSGTLTKIASA